MSNPAIYHSSPDYPSLTGCEVRRELLLTRIGDLWNSGQQVVGIYGPAGIGKSVFGLHAATAFGAIKNKGARVLWLELGLFPEGGGIISQLGDCLEKMGLIALARRMRAVAQEDLPILIEELRQTLGSKCLLIIDQTEKILDERGQIPNASLREILPVIINKSGWATLFTARKMPPVNLFSGMSIFWLEIEDLTVSERRTLLKNLLPASPLNWEALSAETQELIVREVAGHPYLCRLFLSEPGDDPLATLSAIRRRGYGCEAAMDYYLARVPLASRPLLELIATLADREPWPFIEGAFQTLGGILGWPARPARGTLEDLIRRSLVESGTSGYRLLPLVRDYLLQTPPPIGLSAGIARIFHFHLARLYAALANQVREQASAFLNGEEPDVPERVGELIHYHAVLRDRAVRHALKCAQPGLIRQTLDNLIEPTPWPWSASLTAARCLALTQQLTRLIELESQENPLEIGRCWHTIGRTCATFQAPEQALTAYQKSLSCWENTQQPHRMGETLVQIGELFAHLARWEQALQAYQSALDWWERTRQYLRMGSAWHQIGMIYAAQKNWRAALEAYHTALDWQGRTLRQHESPLTWEKIAEANQAAGQQNRG